MWRRDQRQDAAPSYTYTNVYSRSCTVVYGTHNSLPIMTPFLLGLLALSATALPVDELLSLLPRDTVCICHECPSSVPYPEASKRDLDMSSGPSAPNANCPSVCWPYCKKVGSSGRVGYQTNAGYKPTITVTGPEYGYGATPISDGYSSPGQGRYTPTVSQRISVAPDPYSHISDPYSHGQTSAPEPKPVSATSVVTAARPTETCFGDRNCALQYSSPKPAGCNCNYCPYAGCGEGQCSSEDPDPPYKPPGPDSKSCDGTCDTWCKKNEWYYFG